MNYLVTRFKIYIKTITIAAVLVCVFLSGSGQSVSVYKTYNDYISKKPENFETVKYSKPIMTFKGSGDNVKYKTDEIWGFEFNGHLYRTSNSDLFVVSSQPPYGKIILYGEGGVWVNLDKGKTVWYMDPAEVMTTYIGSGLNDEIFITGFNPINSKPPKKYKKGYEDFQAKYPEYQKVYDCVGDHNYKLQDLMECINTYNKKNP